MYGKIFDSMYKGTLYGQWEAIVTFQQMIVLCDADGTVDMTPPAIAAITSIPLDIIQKGIEVLSREDPYSRTPGRNGRRIELIDEHRPWGWVIVNHNKYKRLQDSDSIRAQTKERVRKHREMKLSVTDGNARVTDGNGQKRHTDTDTDTKPLCASGDALLHHFAEFWKAYPKKKNKGDAEKAWKKIKPTADLVNLLLQSIQTAKNSDDWKKENGQFIPYPASWLNAKGWEDDYADQRKPSSLFEGAM